MSIYNYASSSAKATASAGSHGIGFFGLLTVLFVGLKLTGFISWSWLWVLSPIWLPFVVGLAIFGIIAAAILFD